MKDATMCKNCNCNNEKQNILKDAVLRKLAELKSHKSCECNDSGYESHEAGEVDIDIDELVEIVENAKNSVEQTQDIVESIEESLDDLKEAIGQAEEDLERIEEIIENLQ